MDQSTHQDSAQSANHSSQSVPGPSDVPSAVVPPKSLHQQAAATKTPAVAASDPAPLSTISRWSEGTFGSATASQSTSNKQGSSTYSGKSAEATIAQAAAPTLVDTSPPQQTTSADYVKLFQSMDPVSLQIVLSSGHNAKETRVEKPPGSQDTEESSGNK